MPDPGLIFDTILSFQRSAAIKAAIELDLFTRIADGANTAESLAAALGTSLRSVRILCDYLVIIGLLSKADAEYSLTADVAVFLNRKSPAYIGGITAFMLSPELTGAFSDLARTVRQGTTTMPEQGTITPENPLWVDFANSMTAMVRPAAMQIAAAVAGENECRVLDIAAGHGLFGIAIAQQNPKAHVTALDWPDVLAVASANAARDGVAARHMALAGNAFTIEYGGPYDIVLLTNFLHHFDAPTCEVLLKKVHGALKPGGRAVTLEFVPNPDRVSPPMAATFSLMMLGTTPSGDAYTFAEFDSMFRNAGFAKSELLPLTNSPEAMIVSHA